jgi:nicotinamide-nucleotide amidase
VSTNSTRARSVIERLSIRGWRLALAESCTGGLISATITSESGASSILEASITAYANEAKEALLGVPKQMMIDHGAVSAQVALHMAQAAQRAAASDVGLGVTGVAGPGGGTVDKPVGRIYLAVTSPNGELSTEFNFTGDRDAVRDQTVTAALDALLTVAEGADGSP